MVGHLHRYFQIGSSCCSDYKITVYWKQGCHTQSGSLLPYIATNLLRIPIVQVKKYFWCCRVCFESSLVLNSFFKEFAGVFIPMLLPFGVGAVGTGAGGCLPIMVLRSICGVINSSMDTMSRTDLAFESAHVIFPEFQFSMEFNITQSFLTCTWNLVWLGN